MIAIKPIPINLTRNSHNRARLRVLPKSPLRPALRGIKDEGGKHEVAAIVARFHSFAEEEGGLSRKRQRLFAKQLIRILLRHNAMEHKETR